MSECCGSQLPVEPDSCGCGSSCNDEATCSVGGETNPGVVKLQVLGTGCPKCKTLAENTELAAKELGIEYELVKVTDINQIMAFGVMITPALVVDGKVKISGKVPDSTEIKSILSTQGE